MRTSAFRIRDAALASGRISAFGRRGPPVVRQERRPAWPAWVLVVRIRPQLAVERGVLRDLVAIQSDPEPRSRWHGNGAVLVGELPALDDVVGEVMVVRVRSETQVGDD